MKRTSTSCRFHPRPLAGVAQVFGIPALQDRLTDFAHDIQIAPYIMERGEGGIKDLASLKQVAQIGARKSRASVAIAVGIDWPGIVFIARLLDADSPLGGEQA